VVKDGNVITAGGVTSGIDFGLSIAAELAGEIVAQTIQLGIEYDPAPPFGPAARIGRPRARRRRSRADTGRCGICFARA